MEKISQLVRQLREQVDVNLSEQPNEELSRKYYVEIANIIRESNTKAEIVEGLVQFFKADNPRFQPEQFLRAAGMSEPDATTTEAATDDMLMLGINVGRNCDAIKAKIAKAIEDEDEAALLRQADLLASLGDVIKNYVASTKPTA